MDLESNNLGLNMKSDSEKAAELVYNNRAIKSSTPLIKAYENLLNTTIETMQAHDPEHAKYWTWGVCEVSDICYEEAHFYYGSDDDKPKDFPKSQKVWVKIVNAKPVNNRHTDLLRRN